MSDETLSFKSGTKELSILDLDDDMEVGIEIQGADTLQSYEAFYINEAQADDIIKHLDKVFGFGFFV